MATFRNPAARDRAWANHYAKRGLRVPVLTAPKSTPNTFRLANYLIRRGQWSAQQVVSEREIRC